MTYIDIGFLDGGDENRIFRKLEEFYMQGLLYPAYQKLYSALSSLDRFRKEANFFDNISCLDTFFSEYRNVTFAIQSQLRHTEFYEKYEEKRDKYLKDHWFVEKRNEITKQQPFHFQKRITISVYTPSEEITIAEKRFTVEDDIPLDSLRNEIKQFFDNFLEKEIFFSTVYFFSEDDETDLFGRIIAGISDMKSLLDTIYDEIGEECTLCEQLRPKIDRMVFTNVPRDFLFTDDYVYYKDNKNFERAERFAMMFSLDGKKTISRRPLEEMINAKFLNYDGTPFGRFALMHAILRSLQPDEDIMPAIMVIYDDNTYDMDVFHADIKTTVYRKLNEVAKTIDSGDVKEVCFMSLYAVLPFEKDIPVYSKERLQSAVSDILVVSSLDCELNEKEYVFDGKLMEDPQYVGYMMKSGLRNRLNVSRTNMLPVWRAFKNIIDCNK